VAAAGRTAAIPTRHTSHSSAQTPTTHPDPRPIPRRFSTISTTDDKTLSRSTIQGGTIAGEHNRVSLGEH